jgi:hypothetical protein
LPLELLPELAPAELLPPELLPQAARTPAASIAAATRLRVVNFIVPLRTWVE